MSTFRCDIQEFPLGMTMVRNDPVGDLLIANLHPVRTWPRFSYVGQEKCTAGVRRADFRTGRRRDAEQLLTMVDDVTTLADMTIKGAVAAPGATVRLDDVLASASASTPSKRWSILVTGVGPLITLTTAGALDALLLAKLPVIIPDMVRFEVNQDIDKPGAREVAEWIRRHDGQGVRVACTEVFAEFEVLRGVNAATKARNRGEQAAGEVLSVELDKGDFGGILLFEDGMGSKQNFLARLPDEVLVSSTSEFLYCLERHGLLARG